MANTHEIDIDSVTDVTLSQVSEVVPEVSEVVPAPEVSEVEVEPQTSEIVPEPSSPPPPEPITPAPTPELPSDIPKTKEILDKLAKELESFLSGNRLTLSNLTGVVVDLYNFINSYKSLTDHQKTMLLVATLNNFVKNEVDDVDPALVPVIQTLVPRIVDTLVGVSTGKINIGDIVEEIEETAKGCWSSFTACFKKH